MKKIYVIGSLKNKRIPAIANMLREWGYDAFDDWFSDGYEADDKWMEYEQARGRPFSEALYGEHARNVFEFDKHHIDTADAGLMVLPAGRSGHLEFGYIARDKPAFLYFEKEPERFDIMYRFATRACFSEVELKSALKAYVPLR